MPAIFGLFLFQEGFIYNFYAHAGKRYLSRAIYVTTESTRIGITFSCRLVSVNPP